MNKPQKGDIIFFSYGKKAPFLPKLISWYQRLEYYHVGMMMSEETLIEATYKKGIIISHLDQKENDIQQNRLSNYIIKRHVNITSIHQNKLYTKALQYVGNRYDKISLFLNFLLARPVINDPKAFFCSEFVLTLYDEINLPIIKRRPQITTPAELFISPLLIEICKK